MKKKHDEQLEELKKQAEEWKNKYLRALADYQNLEKRTWQDKEETRKFAVSVFLERLLPVVDTLERAQGHLSDTGLALALKELTALLGEFGVERMATEGRAFNPHEMECIEVVEGKANEVIEEVLPGYRLHGKILRVAQVKVGKQNAK
ncbi:MAG: nucleotide exchange factor GrpE [Patescibacteria group bacterium]